MLGGIYIKVNHSFVDLLPTYFQLASTERISCSRGIPVDIGKLSALGLLGTEYRDFVNKFCETHRSFESSFIVIGELAWLMIAADHT